MAFKGHNTLEYVGGSYFADETLVAECGTPVVLKDPTKATGKPGDQNNTVVKGTGAAAEVFVGVLFDDVIAWDRTVCCFPYDRYKNATTPCRPVNMLHRGTFCTDKVDVASNPAAGKPAYINAAGNFSATVAGKVVGMFRGVPDKRGFVSMRIDNM